MASSLPKGKSPQSASRVNSTFLLELPFRWLRDLNLALEDTVADIPYNWMFGKR